MLQIKVDGQHARKINNPVIAADAVNFVRLKAEFSEEWDGLSKSYIFTHVENELSIQVESDADTVLFPHEVLVPGTVTVGIKGTRLAEDGSTLEVRATHAALSYIVSPSGLSDNIANSDLPTATVSEQLRGMVANASPLYIGSSAASVQTGTAKAGGKGYKITAVMHDSTAGTTTYTLSSVDGLEVGMAFSLFMRFYRYNYGVIKAINGNTVTADDANAAMAMRTDANDPDNEDVRNVLMVVNRPDLGDTDVGLCANAEGVDSAATNKATHAEGRETYVHGLYGHAEGFLTSAGWASHAEGYGNHADGNSSHVGGYANSESGSTNCVMGNSNNVNGSTNDVGGIANNVTGNYNFVRGYHNTTSANVQAVLGQYAAPSGTSALTVGWGSGDNARANIFDLDRSGNLQIAGSLNNVRTDELAQIIDEDFIRTFTSEAAIERTCTFHDAEGSYYRNTLKFYTTGRDPFVTTSFKGNTSGYNHFKIRYKISNSGNPTTLSCKLYYGGIKDGFSEERVIEFDAVKDGKWHNEILAINTDNAVNKLRVDIPNLASGNEVIYIKYFGLFSSYDSAEQYLCDDETAIAPSRVTLTYDGANVGYMTYNMIVFNDFSWYSVANKFYYTLPLEFLEGLYKFYGNTSSSGKLSFETLAFMVKDYDYVNSGGTNIRYGNLQELVSGIAVEIDDEENRLHLRIIGDVNEGYSVSKLIIFLADYFE